jgi:hypothetical protein
VLDLAEAVFPTAWLWNTHVTNKCTVTVMTPWGASDPVVQTIAPLPPRGGWHDAPDGAVALTPQKVAVMVLKPAVIATFLARTFVIDGGGEGGGRALRGARPSRRSRASRSDAHRPNIQAQREERRSLEPLTSQIGLHQERRKRQKETEQT